MDYRALTALALRVTGVLIVINVVAGLSYDVVQVMRMSEYSSDEHPARLWTFVAMLGGVELLASAIGLALIVFPHSIATRLAGSGREPAIASTDLGRLQVLAFTVVGIGFAALGLYRILGKLAEISVVYLRMNARWGDDGMMDLSAVRMLVRDAVFLFGGAFLALGSRGLSRLINRVRGYSWDDA